MKKITLHTLLLTSALVLAATAAQAWDFSYSYQNVNSASADTYIVGQQNIMKVTEWQTPPVTYWGPTANGVQGILTSRFNFAAPASEIFLKANLVSFNWTGGPGFGSGSSSMWGSKDGAAWQLLLDNPTPPNGTYARSLVYSQDVPSSLLGGASFWLQVRLQESGASGIAQDGQFCRNDPANPATVFELDAMVVPEPSTLALGMIGVLTLTRGLVRRQRR